ncbi:HAD family hydrolase [Vibrio sp. SCSIO 43132]|uniref:HAD family hydrolase n=1 Tax=Vibrio sp. SCSIO 43132 TaxID=2779363 RepID=UPI001CA8031B|nr:HAD family hydrolase [Vibrio sp. SCSIO 43132]UAB71755.1 HAD family hydrolase [Vibrio sp. SCSIO 43132]
MTKPLFVFDLDETLVNGDCSMIWNQFLVDEGVATQPNFLSEDKRLMAMYAQGDMDMQEYLDFSLNPITEHSIIKVNQLVEKCVLQRILKHVFPQARDLLAQLKQDDVTILVISASVHFLVKHVANQLGIEHAIGIDLIENNERYTTKISGVASYQHGKVTRLKSWLKEQNVSYDRIIFYTDSINDLPLCQYADEVHLVNPCPQIRSYGFENNWNIINW